MKRVKKTIRASGDFTEGITPDKTTARHNYGILNISVSGDWHGKITLMRSHNQGKSWKDVKVYRRNREDSREDLEHHALYRIGAKEDDPFSGIAYVRLSK